MKNDFPVVGARTNLSASVAALIEERILSGDLGPGDRLPPEPELSRQFGVSRSVVRDASQALAARGLLSIRRGIGTTVTSPDSGGFTDAAFLMLVRGDATVREALEARIKIEVMVAGIAAERRGPDDVALLRDCLRTFLDAGARSDVISVREADLAFHGAILKATRQPVLTALLGPLGEIIQRTSMTPLATVRSFDLEKHTYIVDAIVAGDVAAAREAMRVHFLFMEDPIYASVHAQPLRTVPSLMEIREEMQHGSA